MLYFFFSALILISPALYNRFPLVFSDSGTYMASSFDLVPPLDRPLGYGLFMRIVSWKASMWLVVFFQGLLGSYLIFKSLRVLVRDAYVKPLHLLTIITLTLCSGLGWYASQLMPDVFSGLLILTLFLLFETELKNGSFYMYLVLFFFFVITHFSYLPLSLLLVAGFFIFYLRKGPAVKNLKTKTLLIVSIWFCALQFLMLNNYRHGNGYKLSPSSNVFLAARLSESGILGQYLNDNCEAHPSSLCTIKDSLPTSTADFLWSDKGPLARHHWDWKKADQEYAPVINDILTQPRYLKSFIGESFKAGFVQLFQVDIGSGLTSYRENSAPYYPLRDHIKREMNEMLHAQQNTQGLNFTFLNLLNYLVLCGSLAIVFLSWYFRMLTEPMKRLILFVVAGIICNAFITASLANVYDRLQARVTWLLVYVAFICLVRSIAQLWKQYTSVNPDEKTAEKL